MDSLQQNRALNISLTFLVAFFTVFTSVIGATFYTLTYIPLSQRQIRGQEAIIIYKVVNMLGLILVPLALAIGTVCIVVIKCKLASHAKSLPPQPLLPLQPTAAECRAEAKRMPVLQMKSQMPWDAVEQPDYEYINELVLAFVREKMKEKEQLIIDLE